MESADPAPRAPYPLKRRAFLWMMASGLITAPLAAEAQPAGKMWRVGFLAGGARPPDGAPPPPLRQALQELGYVEQQNVVYLGRWAEAKRDRLPGLAAELVGLNVDVIVTVGGPASEAIKQATSSIPIVLALVGDADSIGLIESLARPGGNVTGVTVVAGYLVWQGYFRLPIVLAVGVISAVAGDNIAYWLGRRYGPVAVARVARWAAVDADRMESMRRFMLRHGALAVFLLITVSHPRHRRPRGMAATPVETEALS